MRGRRYSIVLNEAEVRALRQIQRRDAALSGFERDLLGQILRKVDSSRDESWRRFVWTREDVALLQRGPGHEPSSLGTADEHVVRFANYDALMDDIDRIIGRGE
jgi:hypothetical protein